MQEWGVVCSCELDVPPLPRVRSQHACIEAWALLQLGLWRLVLRICIFVVAFVVLKAWYVAV